jgi:hypothetical protein
MQTLALARATAVTLSCLYAPIAWIAFSDRAPFYYNAKERIVFFVTLPGEWFAQNCGARMYDYYAFAAFATIGLIALGIAAGRHSRFTATLSGITLLGWSFFFGELALA